ncbi:MAG: histone deacetylase [Ectothiorhodospiraceae bacterium]|nr:histone deacetylase [Chromatiales bacterium]MCP5155728.1 histone deacetylase [Ectothiorhodospiraceae bacterium]
MTTALLYDPRFLDHDPGRGHPERRERLERSITHIEAQPWAGGLRRVTPPRVDPRWVNEVHSLDLMRRAEAACLRGHSYLDVPDVGICEQSYEVAMLAAGGALVLGDQVMRGEVDNAFSLSRPPGHHAERDIALGFCLFNNAAILARYLQREHGLQKVLVLDWDVHHGNGTQHAFEDDPSVLYVSTHQYPYYPGTGAAHENGTGRGVGATLNCPMPAGAGDAEYEETFRTRILPAVDAFAPEAVILSAGFDAHRDDPLAGIALSTGFFAWMTLRMMEVADRHAGGRLISLLEGGYNLERLPECIAAHLEVLCGARGEHGAAGAGSD